MLLVYIELADKESFGVAIACCSFAAPACMVSCSNAPLWMRSARAEATQAAKTTNDANNDRPKNERIIPVIMGNTPVSTYAANGSAMNILPLGAIRKIADVC